MSACHTKAGPHGWIRSPGQVIGRDGTEVAAVGGAGPKTPLLRGAQAQHAQEPRHPVPPARLPGPAQDHGEPGAAVRASARLEALLDLRSQTRVVPGARTLGFLLRGVVAAAAHAQCAAKRFDRELAR